METAAAAGERATRTHAGDEVGYGREIAKDLVGRAFLVRERVRGVPVLERHEVLRVACERPRDFDRSVRSLLSVAEDDLGTEEPQESDALLARVVGDDDGELVALAGRHHGECDAGVAGGGLEDGAVPCEIPRRLGYLDHLFRDAVLRRAGRVVALELGPEAHA